MTRPPDFTIGMPTPIKPEDWKCDFCSGRPVRWSYPARDSRMGTISAQLSSGSGVEVTGMSHGDWACCDECHQLIARADREGLSARASARSRTTSGQPERVPPTP
jgi:hypothetical protein